MDGNSNSQQFGSIKIEEFASRFFFVLLCVMSCMTLPRKFLHGPWFVKERSQFMKSLGS